MSVRNLSVVPSVRLLAGIVLVLLAGRPVAAQPGTVSLSGHVADGAGAASASVAIAIAGGSGPVAPVTTDATGAFTVGGLVPGVYTVTPSRAGFVYAPASRSVTLLRDAAGLDFVEAVVSHTVAGQVVDATGGAVAGVAVTIDGASPATVTTDAAGRFAFFHVPPGGPLTVTPSLAGFTFAPASHAIGSVDADVAVPRFTVATGRFQRYLAEGVTNAFFDTRIALLNPALQPAAARLSFQTSSGRVVEHEVVLAARSRATIDPRAVGVGEADFSTVIESTQPLVVDRTVRWDASGYGSHAESSLASPQATWYFAEGATTGSFELFYLLQNPGTQAATVQIRYLRPAPLAPIEKSYTVAPASRRTIYVNQEDPALAEAEISAVIASQNGVPIIAERAMYASVAGQVFGAGHESAGLPAPSAQWFLAEGATGPFFNLFLLVANPTATAAPLEVRYLLTDGRVITRQHTAAANSRLTIGVHGEHPDLASAAMSAIVTSTTGVPVLVERAMWWPANAPAWYEAHASAGATATAMAWATADGEAGGPSGAETYLLIANTAGHAGSSRVTLVFEDGGTATRTFPLLPSSRRNVAIGAEFPEAANRRFGAIVESLGPLPVPIVVERAMYSNAGGVVWAAGSNLVATPLVSRAAVPVILAAPQPAGVPAPPVTVAGILGGEPESPAVAALPDVIAEERTPLDEISEDAEGRRFARTKLEIGFARTATVAQVNGVLDALGGRIVNAIAGVAVITVRIPDPGSLPALEAVAARARTLPTVRVVALVTFSDPQVVPETFPGTLGSGSIDHLLAARVPAAWNAAAALDAPSSVPPRLLIEDFFGAGPTNAAVDASLVASDYALGNPHVHGYHVLATMLGTFAGVGSLNDGADQVVGLFPRRADVRVVERQSASRDVADVHAVNNTLIRFVRDLPGRVVLNSSTAFRPPRTLAQNIPIALTWIEKVRTGAPGGTSLEGKFVHAKAAGNSTSALAVLASEQAVAVLQTLSDATGSPVPNLTNTLIVENVLNTAVEPFEPGCRAVSSNVGGNIAAVGTAVFSLLDPGTSAGDLDGTSMATPQVGALALYLWALAPTLSAQDVVARIRATARPGVAQTDALCSAVAFATAPAIDAYAALLSADQGLSAPLVRSTLLDIADATGADQPDGLFDEHDLIGFLAALDAGAGAFDYSRYDLNGDGRTGGTATARFDLDANVLPAWTVVTETVEAATATFDERGLSDIQILCYYAYSPLFEGDTAARQAALAPRCIDARLTMHVVSINMSWRTGSINQHEQHQRPDATTDMATPFEISVARSDVGDWGTAEMTATIEADDVAVADASGAGLRRAELRWHGTCAVESVPGSPGAHGSSAVHADLRFTVGDPDLMVRLEGVLPASGPVSAPNVALTRDDQSVAFTSNTGSTPVPFAHQVQGPGSYVLRVNGVAPCAPEGGTLESRRDDRLSTILTISAVP